MNIYVNYVTSFGFLSTFHLDMYLIWEDDTYFFYQYDDFYILIGFACALFFHTCTLDIISLSLSLLYRKEVTIAKNAWDVMLSYFQKLSSRIEKCRLYSSSSLLWHVLKTFHKTDIVLTILLMYIHSLSLAFFTYYWYP